MFSPKTISLLKVKVSRLRARPKGFPIALWNPSGRPFDAMLLMQNSIKMRKERLTDTDYRGHAQEYRNRS